jgi:hypothetical protein
LLRVTPVALGVEYPVGVAEDRCVPKVAVRVAVLAVGVSLLTTSATAQSGSRKLTLKDAVAALHAIGVTKTFIASPPASSSPHWGPLVMVTGGAAPAQPLTVHVFPNADMIRSFLKAYPPIPKSVAQQILGVPIGYLPNRVVCNALVSSSLLPSASRPTAAERHALQALNANTAADQSRVVAYLQRRCR